GETSPPATAGARPPRRRRGRRKEDRGGWTRLAQRSSPDQRPRELPAARKREGPAAGRRNSDRASSAPSPRGSDQPSFRPAQTPPDPSGRIEAATPDISGEAARPGDRPPVVARASPDSKSCRRFLPPG